MYNVCIFVILQGNNASELAERLKLVEGRLRANGEIVGALKVCSPPDDRWISNLHSIIFSPLVVIARMVVSLSLTQTSLNFIFLLISQINRTYYASYCYSSNLSLMYPFKIFGRISMWHHNSDHCRQQSRNSID